MSSTDVGLILTIGLSDYSFAQSLIPGSPSKWESWEIRVPEGRTFGQEFLEIKRAIWLLKKQKHGSIFLKKHYIYILIMNTSLFPYLPLT